MIDTLQSDGLVIALEPEAAGVLCRTIPAAAFGGARGTAEAPNVGDAYVVIDAGGILLEIKNKSYLDIMCIDEMSGDDITPMK